MKIDIYQKEAKRTMANLDQLVYDSIHMTVGMNTECTEILEAFRKTIVDDVNMKEEIGDLMWYVGNYATLHKLPLTDQITFTNTKTSKDLIEDILICVGNLQDLDKKLFAYKKPYDAAKQYGFFIHLNQLILQFTKQMHYDFEAILQTNIDKLRKRYPDKFDEESAINRDLEAEREILES